MVRNGSSASVRAVDELRLEQRGPCKRLPFASRQAPYLPTVHCGGCRVVRPPPHHLFCGMVTVRIVHRDLGGTSVAAALALVKLGSP